MDNYGVSITGFLKEGITRDDQTLGVLTARGVVSCLNSSIVFSTIYW
jgi:hypothetical protein